MHENDFVFPGPGTRGRIVDTRKFLPKTRDLSRVRFTYHDLRRTFITIAESLDIPRYALKRLVNRKMGGVVTAGYIVPDVERLREPMQRTTACILQHCLPSKELRSAIDCNMHPVKASLQLIANRKINILRDRTRKDFDMSIYMK